MDLVAATPEAAVNSWVCGGAWTDGAGSICLHLAGSVRWPIRLFAWYQDRYLRRLHHLGLETLMLLCSGRGPASQRDHTTSQSDLIAQDLPQAKRAII